MPSWNTLLVVFLRGTAAVLLLALPAVVLPHSWMNAVHEAMGLGTLPDGPLVGYLTRSASALYASLGLLYLYLSFDPRRWLDLIVVLAWIKVGFGTTVLLIDLLEGMPWYWTAAEGPFILLHSALALLLVAKNRHIPS